MSALWLLAPGPKVEFFPFQCAPPSTISTQSYVNNLNDAKQFSKSKISPINFFRFIYSAMSSRDPNYEAFWAVFLGFSFDLTQHNMIEELIQEVLEEISLIKNEVKWDAVLGESKTILKFQVRLIHASIR